MKLTKILLPNNGGANNLANSYGIAVEFKRRLEAYGAHYGIVLNGSGYRNIVIQAKYYLDYKADPLHHNPSAYPGNSWHNCGLAYDVQRIGNDPDGSGRYPASMEADFLLPPTQQELNKWGLCIPMWKGSSEKENWHVQPIETIGISSNRQSFLDEDDLLNTPSGYRTLQLIEIPDWTLPAVYMKGSDVKRFQRAVGLEVVDGVFGEKSESAAIALQLKNELEADGVIGSKTWEIINAIINTPVTPPVDYKALYDAELVKNTALTKSISDLQSKLTKAESVNAVLADQIQQMLPYISELAKFL